jgi:O-antigen/teichoic acid export membrane protein
MLKKVINKFKGNLFVYNAIWNMGGKVLQMGLSLIVGMLTARYLGPSNYGVIGYTASFISFFSVICQLGFTSVAVKELLDNREREGEVLGTSIFLRVCTSIISTIAITIMIYIIDDGDRVIVWVAFLQSLSLLFQSFEMFHYWYQSRMETQVSVKVQTAAYLVMSAYKITLLALGMRLVETICSSPMSHPLNLSSLKKEFNTVLSPN